MPRGNNEHKTDTHTHTDATRTKVGGAREVNVMQLNHLFRKRKRT